MLQLRFRLLYACDGARLKFRLTALPSKHHPSSTVNRICARHSRATRAETPAREAARKTSLTSYGVCHTVCARHCMTHGPLPPDPALFDNLRLELRRGYLTVAVLAALRTEQYGYTLRKLLSEQGLVVDESTLYPLLRRLETQGLLTSEWREEAKRNKRFYRISEQGAQVLTLLLA
jgi:PadR family transcriptional regulator PadR